MINLIPSEERKKMVKNFYLRFATVFFVAFGIVILVASVAILPTYFFSSVKKNLASSKLEIQKNEPAPVIDQKILSAVEDLNKKLSLIEHVKENRFFISQKVINAIVLKKTPDIKIIQISFDADSQKGKKISINGIA